jgi:mono/diheme cytochrome c family protein
MRFKFAMIATSGLVVFAVGAAAAVSQNATRSVWDGVYTTGQAKRGQTSFGNNCGACHGEELDGSESAPTLTGHEFMLVWGGRNLSDLLNRIHDTMPAGQPGKLSREEDADILAYILAFNKFPAGASELPTQSEILKQIRLDAEKPVK